MIDAQADVTPMSTNISKALQKTFQYAMALRVAANVCAANFTWLHLNSLRHIPLLDFDVICGASPRLSIQKRLSGEETDREPISLMDYPGSATTRQLLELLPSFVIPPGTTAEILDRKQRLSDTLSNRSTAFLARIREAVSSSDPMDILFAPHHGSTRELFVEDLTCFSEDFRDRSLLQSLLDRATPTEDLLSDDPPDSSALEAVKSSYTFLQTKRPRLSNSNLHDALNAGLVVRLFNSKRMRREANFVPVLISQTRAVHQLSGISQDYLKRLGSREFPFLFTNALFLIVSEGLLARTEGRYMTAVDAAAALEQEAAGLADSCMSLLDINKRISPVKRFSDVSAKDLTENDDWNMLLFRRGLFQRHWGSLFATSAMVEERDRMEYLELLLTNNWRDKVKPGDPQSFDKSLQNFIGELEHSRPADYQIWSAIVESSLPKRDPIVVEPVFRFYMREDDGTLLRDISSGAPLELQSPAVLATTHNIQIAVCPVYLSCGASLVVKSFKDVSISERRYLKVTWLHNSSPSELALMLQRIAAAHLGSHVELTACLYTDREEICAAFPVVTLSENLRALCEGRQNAECFLLAASGFRCFADLIALESSELQIGITVPAETWTAAFQKEVVNAMAATSEIPMNYHYGARLLSTALQPLLAPSTHAH